MRFTSLSRHEIAVRWLRQGGYADAGVTFMGKWWAFRARSVGKPEYRWCAAHIGPFLIRCSNVTYNPILDTPD